MKKLQLIIAGIIVSLLLSGCATSPIRVINKNTLPAEAEKTGMVFFKLDCPGEPMAVVYLHLSPDTDNPKEKSMKVRLREKGTFNGNFKFDPTYFLLEMPEGRWRVDRISDDTAAMSYMYGVGGYLAMRCLSPGKLGKIKLKFDVAPGVVSYLGTIKFALNKRNIEFDEILDEEEEARRESLQNFPQVTKPLENKDRGVRPQDSNIILD